MNTDPISDYLTRIRNAVKAGHRVVEIPASNLKKEITKISVKWIQNQYYHTPIGPGHGSRE